MTVLKHVLDRFTTTSLVGVDVGSAAIKVVELEPVEGRVVLRHCAVAPIKEGDAASVLKQLVVDAGITTTRAALALASPQVIVKPFQFPSMPRKELANAIRLEAEQAILNGHTIKDMAIDWQTLTSNSDEAIRGLLSVVPKTAVTARLNTARAAGLRPSIVDVEGLALWNAYWTLVGAHEPALKTMLLLNIGAKTTNVVLARGPDELILVRDVQLGGQTLTTDQAQEWLAEVRDSLSYARAQGGFRTLDAVYVTGGGSGPKAIPLLKSILSAPLTFWNPLNGLTYDAGSPSIDQGSGPLFAIAIGLALRQPT